MLKPAISHRFRGEFTFWRLWGLGPEFKVRCCLKSFPFISTITEIPKGLVATKHLQYECKKM